MSVYKQKYSKQPLSQMTCFGICMSLVSVCWHKYASSQARRPANGWQQHETSVWDLHTIYCFSSETLGGANTGSSHGSHFFKEMISDRVWNMLYTEQKNVRPLFSSVWLVSYSISNWRSPVRLADDHLSDTNEVGIDYVCMLGFSDGYI